MRLRTYLVIALALVCGVSAAIGINLLLRNSAAAEAGDRLPRHRCPAAGAWARISEQFRSTGQARLGAAPAARLPSRVLERAPAAPEPGHPPCSCFDPFRAPSRT